MAWANFLALQLVSGHGTGMDPSVLAIHQISPNCHSVRCKWGTQAFGKEGLDPDLIIGLLEGWTVIQVQLYE